MRKRAQEISQKAASFSIEATNLSQAVVLKEDCEFIPK